MKLRDLIARMSAGDVKTPKTTKKATRAAGQQEWLRHVAPVARDELFVELGSREEGLASDQVESAREFYGTNAVAQAAKKPLPLRLLAAFADPFTYILIFIAAISVLTDWVFATGTERDLSTPLIIGAMVLVSGVLRFVQDEKSTVAAEALAEMVESTAEVERDGDGGNETPIDEIVVGDVIHLSSGDIVPADLRIFAARDLFVSQASLTGESEPIEKRAELAEDGAVIGRALTDLEDLAFMGSTVISGNARGIVVATGARTMFGEATGTLVGRKRETSFDTGIKSTSRLLMRLMFVMLPFVFVISGVTKGDWVAALLFSLSVAVGLTPEMLPMLVTTCLGKGAVDLSRDRVIVKRLDAIQDLGAVDVLCTDKTGTLTRACPTVVQVVPFHSKEENDMLRLAACLEEHYPHSMANAVVEEAKRRGLTHEEYHSQVQYVVAHGISSMVENKKVIIGSAHFVFEDEGCCIPEGEQEKYDALPAAYSHLYLCIDGELAAVICIHDPLRREAKDAVKALHESGFTNVVMMTGDNRRTAESVAAEVGVDAVYAEVLPEDKAAFIRQEKEKGHTVIMVGDGVNDSPALSEADAGIAISTGAAIAREIADITVASEDLFELVTLRKLSEALMDRIHGSYRFIVAFNLSLITLGVAGVLPPAISALLHNTSTLGIGLKNMTDLLEEHEGA